VCLREAADGVGRGGAGDSAKVVGEAHGSAAKGGGEGFGGDDGEAGEEAGAKETYERAKEKDGGRAACEGIDRHESSGDQEISDVDALAGETVCEDAEEGVAEEGSRLHKDGEGRGADDVEPVASLRDGEREEGRHPGEESPPGEERSGVHAGDDESGAEEGRVEQAFEAGCGLGIRWRDPLIAIRPR
jgi:hypothetical protein